MRQCWLPSAAVVLCAGGAWAETPVGAPVIAPTLLEQPAREAMPGAVISTLPSPSNAAAQPAGNGHVVGGCSTCSDGGCGHGSTLQRLRDWLCFQSHRPRQCTDTPTLYRPPLYMYFRCYGCNQQPHWPVDRCDPRLFQMGLPPDFPPPGGAQPPTVAAPPADTPGAPAGVTKSAPADGPADSTTPTTLRSTDPDKPRTQGPLLPGSAAANAQCACGTCAAPTTAPVLKSASPYAVIQAGAKDNAQGGFRPVPVYIPSFPSRFDRR